MADFDSTAGGYESRNPGLYPEDLQRAEAQQERLFEALGIVQLTRYAVESKLEGLDQDFIVYGLKAAGRLIDEVAAALEVNISDRPPAPENGAWRR